MITVAILRAVGFSHRPNEDYIFYLIQRGHADMILLEEKSTDKRYRIEYDNQYRTTEDVVQEIIEELRTRKFDNLSVPWSDEAIAWTCYSRVVEEICDLVEHGVTSFVLHGTTGFDLRTPPEGTPTLRRPVELSLVPELEQELKLIEFNQRVSAPR